MNSGLPPRGLAAFPPRAGQPGAPGSRGFRTSLITSLALHAVLVTVLFAGAPGPLRRTQRAEKIYTVNLASLPRAGGGTVVTSAEPKGRPPRPTTQRVKKPPPEDTKPKVNLERPKKKKQEEKPEPPPPIKSNEPATKASEPAPVGSPEGTEKNAGALGLPAGGSGIGLSGAGTDTDFPFTYYLVAVRNKIANQWSPPRGVSAGGAPLRVTLYFRILRGGTVSDIAVEQTSGVDFYDQSAMRAVQAAMPLPPLPEEFPDEYLGVHFDFQFVE